MRRLALSAVLVASMLAAPPTSAAADPIPDGAVVDEFDAPALGQDWSVLSPDAAQWSLSELPGSLRVHSLPGDTYQGTNSAGGQVIETGTESSVMFIRLSR